MLDKQGKVSALTTLVNDGALSEALTFAVLNRFPDDWVKRCHALLMERDAHIYAAAEIPVADEDDIVTRRRYEIMEEMKRDRAERKKMNSQDAKQAASMYIRQGKFSEARKLEKRFGRQVISKTYLKGTSKYVLWCKRQRLDLIGEYRNLLIVDPKAAQAFRRKHEIQESEINPTFD